MSKIKEKFKTSIGGQALIEGVMMRGPSKIAVCVRTPDGEIYKEYIEPDEKKWFNKVPIIRGTANLIASLKKGYQSLMISVDKSGFEEDEQPSKLEEIFGNKIYTVVSVISVILGVLLSVFLFTILPAFLTSKIASALNLGFSKNLIEGAFRIIIFFVYLALVSNMKDIRRTFEYHGAEHKVIACYEAMLPLNVENAKKCTRFHRRCGTSFLLISVLVSIFISTFVTWETVLIRVLLKIILLPLVIGLSYEIIQWAGKTDNIITKIISAPGLLSQRLTTKEPDAAQLEVALSALKAVIPEDAESDRLK